MALSKRTFNPKRRICPDEETQKRREVLLDRLALVHYRGNPEHKRNPGDHGLPPPLGPRPGKTLCDQVQIFTHSEAIRLLRAGFQRGTFSVQERNGWPQ